MELIKNIELFSHINIKKKLWGVILCIEYWLLKMRMTFRKY